MHTAERPGLAGVRAESEAAEVYAISRVRWLDLRTEADWGPDLTDDPEIYLQLDRARRTLGYPD